jgi:hypothetical protein
MNRGTSCGRRGWIIALIADEFPANAIGESFATRYSQDLEQN